MMDDLKKKIVIGYCIAIILSCAIVPWKVDLRVGQLDKGYSFILFPPIPTASIDMCKILLEWVGITAGACIVYLGRQEIFKDYCNKKRKTK